MHGGEEPDHNVVIVGAGFGGIGMGIALKERAGISDFVIYERASDIGGTWRANTYPGCHSDLHIHAYSLSTDLKPDWPRLFASQADILEYMQDVVTRHGVRPHCVFNTSVTGATWDPKANLWRIVIEDVQSGAITHVSAKIFISATGILSEPNKPYIPGAEDFQGHRFHTAEWDHSVDLHGKRVAVIGSGASAAQIIPVITTDPTTEVINFCRTQTWFFEGTNYEYSAFWKWVYANIPFVMRMHRVRLEIGYDIFYFLFRWKDSWISRVAAKVLTDFMLTRAPKEYHAKLIPSYVPGCKRGVRNMGYLEALHRPNNTIEWSGIEKLTENGILTQAGVHHPIDVVVYATGFITDKYFLDVRGSANKTVQEFFEEQGGPAAYLGSTLPGFPNFMIMQGPNTTSGHSSVVYSEECQFQYAIQLFKPVIDGYLESVEPTIQAHDRYNNWLQGLLGNSVFTRCHSWYRVGSQGKIFNVFPGPISRFWLWTRDVRWSDYVVRGSRKSEWEKKRRNAKALRILVISATLAAVASAVYLSWITQVTPSSLARSAKLQLIPAFNQLTHKSIASIRSYI